MRTLNMISAGNMVKVLKLHGDSPMKRKIMDMGITKNTELLVKKIAPLGDPMEIHLRGYALTLRKEDAAIIEVL